MHSTAHYSPPVQPIIAEQFICSDVYTHHIHQSMSFPNQLMYGAYHMLLKDDLVVALVIKLDLIEYFELKGRPCHVAEYRRKSELKLNR